MPFARHEFTVTDEHGNIVTDAQVEVRREVPGQPLAVLYSDRDGLTPLGNPFSVDAVTAVAAFHVVGGAYRVRAFKTGFERIERYVGIGTASETDAGLLAVAVSPTWLFDDATADADPGDGEFRLNNASPASATAAYIDNLAFGGVDVSAWLDTLDDSGDATTRGFLTIFDPTAPTTIFRLYAVSGSVVDGTGYRKLTLVHVAGAGSFTAGVQYQIAFAQRGPIGQVPSSRTITAGTGLTGGGDLSADRTLALANMAQATIKGRASGAGTGAPQDLTAAQAAAILGTLTSVNLQTFTASGTYTPTSGMTRCLVISTGGGGGGGGADSLTDADNNCGAGGGGGAGGTCIELFTAAQIGASQTVTIGAGGSAGSTSAGDGGTGGNTTFGALHTANGGSGGGGNNVSASGGAGGTASGGALNISGGGGGSSTGGSSILGGQSGAGGASFWGGGGLGARSLDDVTGANGAAYGSGGGGAVADSTTGAAGGTGAGGVVFVLEFIA